MQRLLLRRTLRDFKSNPFRYLALCLLIALAMFMVIATVASAESIIKTVDQRASANHLEDGQFGVFAPLAENHLDEINELGVTLEPCFYFDFQMADGATLRLMKNRQTINLLETETGYLPEAENEIAVERIYADAHDLNPGDTLVVADKKFIVTAIVTSPDYDLCLQNHSDMSADGKRFGTAFVTPYAYDQLLTDGKAAHSQEYRYSYRLGKDSSDRGLKDYLRDKVPYLKDFVKSADNPRIKAAGDDVAINIKVGLTAGAIVLILLTYVISVFTIHSIDRESAMIGALYALGLKRKQLMLHYTLLPVTLCLLGGTAGTTLGYSGYGIALMSNATLSYFSIPAIRTFHSPLLLIYGLVLPPMIAFLGNSLIIRGRLSRTALSLLRKEQPATKVSHTALKGLGFVQAFQVRQFLRERRSCFAVLAGIFVSLLILILGLNCYALCRNIQIHNAEDTKYAYMYQYKSPPATVPADGYAAYVKGLQKEALGYTMEVSFIGIESDNPFFPSISSDGPDEISVSASAAEKYGLSVGQKVFFRDKISEKEYGFVVKEIVPYAVGLTCFMDAGSMRTLFEQESDYYNVVYADHALDAGSSSLYSVSTREDVKKSSEIFMEIMLPLMSMLSGAAALIFLIVLYQMTKVMTDRSASSISLMRIFGYRSREIRKLYLDGNFFLVAAGALLMLPLSKVLMDMVYPIFIANVVCGVDLSWPPVLYAVVYGGILLGYLLIRTILMRRLEKVSPAEALKNRE